LIIGSVPDPQSWEHWSQAEAFLEPARKLGNFATVIDPDEALWAVMDGDELLGCATAWLGEGFVEVKLVGGRDHRRWVSELDQVIGAAAAEAGATRLTAWGRAGWTKILRAHGWENQKMTDGSMAYSRRLEVCHR
jgi:hypothetical protein